MRRAVVFTAALMSAAVASVARGQSPRAVDFKLRLAVDQQWAFEQTNTTSLHVSSGGQQFTQAADQRRGGTITVLAVKDGQPTSLKITYSPDTSSTATMNGQPQPPPTPLAGKTVRVSRDELGIIQIDGLEADPATTNELSQLVTPDRSLFPNHPVAVGDEWDGDADAMAKQMQFGPNDTVTVHCKLDRIGTAAGRPTADLAVTITGAKTQDGIVTKLTTAGTVQLDLATCQPLKADLSGKLELNGQANGPNGPMPVSGDGKIELHQTYRPVAGVPAPGPTPTPTPAVVTHGGGGVNPLDDAAPAAPFAGSFKGEKLSIDLTPATADAYTGTLRMGAKSFPAKAKADGTRLTGSFDSNGTAFDFTATLDGPTLTLTSGQTRYTLTKSAPANPLDASPGNPLAP